jgi:site-specific DNA-methyltransferase (adenine-specific)
MNIDDFKNRIIQGDCIEVLRQMPDNSVDAIVTDPPAGISFMGKSWDTDKGGRDHWIEWMQEIAMECKRVLKPGGHALVWAIPRTSHWTATAWENAGFQIRDVIAHIFGSGFPKSLNIVKKIDKLQGNEREEIVNERWAKRYPNEPGGDLNPEKYGQCKRITGNPPLTTKGTSEWEGWGSALKPAREDWLLMRKPLEKGLTVAENVLKWGTGGINIDACRVENTGKSTLRPLGKSAYQKGGGIVNGGVAGTHEVESEFGGGHDGGRFPANLIHDGSDEVLSLFPNTKSGAMNGIYKNTIMKGQPGVRDGKEVYLVQQASGGSAARFFYCAKASKSERNMGCAELGEKERVGQGLAGEKNNTFSKNSHPTVKPIALMEYLIKLVSREGAVVLDPFAGSGSTLVACKNLDRNFIGIEKEPDYVKIAEARLSAVKKSRPLFPDGGAAQSV